jgi:hypothetical protein
MPISIFFKFSSRIKINLKSYLQGQDEKEQILIKIHV